MELAGFNRRHFMKLGTAAAAFTAVPAVLAQVKAPTVSERDVDELFYGLTYASLNNQRPTVTIDLQERYRNAQNDQQRALILAATAMGIADQAAAAARFAYEHAAWRGHDGPEVGQRDLDDAIARYESQSVTYGRKNMKFIQQVSSCANDLLFSAYAGPHRTGNFTTFITGYVMPYKGTDPIPKFYAGIARSLGIQ
jgi:hypothetical protein